jgi:hypothetical protein
MGTEARGVTALVMVEVVAMHLTLPVDMLIADYLPASLDTCHILLSTRPILIEQQL